MRGLIDVPHPALGPVRRQSSSSSIARRPTARAGVLSSHDACPAPRYGSRKARLASPRAAISLEVRTMTGAGGPYLIFFPREGVVSYVSVGVAPPFFR